LLEVVLAAEHNLRSQDVGIVMNLPAARLRQIRDGPIPCRRPLDLLLNTSDRKAA